MTRPGQAEGRVRERGAATGPVDRGCRLAAGRWSTQSGRQARARPSVGARRGRDDASRETAGTSADHSLETLETLETSARPLTGNPRNTRNPVRPEVGGSAAG